MKAQSETDDPVRLLFDRMVSEFRTIVHDEVALLRTEMRQDFGYKDIPLKPRRFYTIKEVAIELHVSQATVRRLIDRGLLRPNKAIRM
jgi:Helix-turn-helix domain